MLSSVAQMHTSGRQNLTINLFRRLALVTPQPTGGAGDDFLFSAHGDFVVLSRPATPWKFPREDFMQTDITLKKCHKIFTFSTFTKYFLNALVLQVQKSVATCKSYESRRFF